MRDYPGYRFGRRAAILRKLESFSVGRSLRVPPTVCFLYQPGRWGSGPRLPRSAMQESGHLARRAVKSLLECGSLPHVGRGAGRSVLSVFAGPKCPLMLRSSRRRSVSPLAPEPPAGHSRRALPHPAARTGILRKVESERGSQVGV